MDQELAPPSGTSPLSLADPPDRDDAMLGDLAAAVPAGSPLQKFYRKLDACEDARHARGISSVAVFPSGKIS